MLFILELALGFLKKIVCNLIRATLAERSKVNHDLLKLLKAKVSLGLIYQNIMTLASTVIETLSFQGFPPYK